MQVRIYGPKPAGMVGPDQDRKNLEIEDRTGQKRKFWTNSDRLVKHRRKSEIRPSECDRLLTKPSMVVRVVRIHWFQLLGVQ